MLVAPLDANTLGKVASGICDNLLVSDSLGPPPSLGLTPSLLSCRLLLFSPWNPFMVGLFARNTVPWTTLHLASPVLQQVGRRPGPDGLTQLAGAL